MAALNHFRLHIGGADYTITTDEPEAYVLTLASKVDRSMKQMMEHDARVTMTMAAVLTAVTMADEAEKTSDSLDHLRSQLQGYLEDSMQARQESEMLKRDLERLRRENEFLRAKQNQFNG